MQAGNQQASRRDGQNGQPPSEPKRERTLEFDFDETATRLKKTSTQPQASSKPKRRLVRSRDKQAAAANAASAEPSATPETEAVRPAAAKQPAPVKSEPVPTPKAETPEATRPAPAAQATAPASTKPAPEAVTATQASAPASQPVASAAKAEPAASPQPTLSEPKATEPQAPTATAATATPALEPAPETKEPDMKPPTTTEYKSKNRNTGGWMGMSPQSTKPRGKTPEGKARSVNDFRQNAARQAKEQKATGNILAWVAYSLCGALVLVTVLAALGGYTLLKMIESQAVTVAELDSKYQALVAEVQNNAEARSQALAIELTEARATAKREREALSKLLQVVNGQVESTQTELIDTQGELAELQKIVKTEAGRRYRGDINNNAKINRVISRVRKLEND